MSFVSMLDQLNLSAVLQRLEAHEKTGMLVVKQGELWVELFFRQGKLMCIGPVRGNASLGERLLHAGVITPAAVRDVMLALGAVDLSETRTAIALMDRGHVSREDLRVWATREATKVIEVLLTWTSGEVYFEEGRQTPPERLLVSLSISTLIQPQLAPEPMQPPVAQPAPAPQPIPTARVTQNLFEASLPTAARVENQPRITQSLFNDSPAEGQGHIRTGSLFDDSILASFAEPALHPASLALPAAEEISSLFDSPASTPDPSAATLPAPTPVAMPIVPQRIDISFMKPEMVLVPTDLSALRERNVEVQLTPDEWRVFTRADGRTTLQMASQLLMMAPDQVCQIAGELMALGLVQHPLALQAPNAFQEYSPVSQNLMMAGMGNGFVMPGNAATSAQAWGAPLPTTGGFNPVGQQRQMPAFETESQWGNGGNGATFTLGRGWGMPPASSMQQPGMPQVASPAYAGGHF